MAEIIQEEKAKGGKKRPKKHPPHIDMTPMVDLMCLLIFFFMLTTVFSKSKVMDITLPDKILDPKQQQEAPKIPKSRTVNIILGPEDKVYWYPGTVDDTKNLPPLFETSFAATGIRQLLLDRNRTLFRKITDFNKQVTEGKIKITQDSVRGSISKLKTDDDTGPIVLIKAYKKANYGNFVDILDEMNICGIARYTIVDIAWYEDKMIETAIASAPTTSTSTK